LSKDHSTDVITAAMINHKTTPYHRIAVQPQRETKTSKRLSYPHHHGIDTDLCDLTHRPANTLTHHPLLHPHNESALTLTIAHTVRGLDDMATLGASSNDLSTKGLSITAWFIDPGARQVEGRIVVIDLDSLGCGGQLT
ncbi:hypothetical protein, partial [Mycobacterium leprae]